MEGRPWSGVEGFIWIDPFSNMHTISAAPGGHCALQKQYCALHTLALAATENITGGHSKGGRGYRS